jgi:two-component system sensor kinase FixL
MSHELRVSRASEDARPFTPSSTSTEELADFATESVIVFDIEGVVRYWNPASEALYGWPAMAAIDRHIGTLLANQDRDDEHRATLLREGSWRGPVRRTTAAGTHITTFVRQTVRYTQDGRPRDVVEFGGVTDISIARPSGIALPQPPSASAACWELNVSDIQELARHLAATGRQRHIGSEDEPLPLGDLLARTTIVNVNERGVRLFGGNLDREHMIGHPISSFWPTDCQSVLLRLLLDVLTQTTWEIIQAPAPRTNGLLHDASLAAWRSLERGRSDALFLMVSGVASDNRTAWELRASEDRYRKLLYHMPMALWHVDARGAVAAFERLNPGHVADIDAFLETHPELVELALDVVRVTEVNRDAISLFHAPSAAELIRPVRYLFEAAPGLAKRVMVAHLEGRRNYSEQTRIRTLDGQVRDVIFSMTFPAPPEQLDTTFVTMLDVTGRLALERDLRTLEVDHAAQALKLGELATSIAHEIKQPLAAVITNAETSLRWLDREDAQVSKIKQLTNRVVSSAHRANDIIQRIRFWVARGKPERTELDLREVAEEAITFVRHDIEGEHIDLSLDVTQGLPKILGDRVQLQQVMVNLLINAVQAIAQTQCQERKIQVSIAPCGGTCLCFSVRDSGPGIASGDFAQIFDSFYTTKEGGMGIGLAICQSIITEHGGHILASNHAEGGALFHFDLPAASS